MSETEFMDRLFDVLNETDALPIQDIIVDAKENTIKVYLSDGTLVILSCEFGGKWWLFGA